MKLNEKNLQPYSLLGYDGQNYSSNFYPVKCIDNPFIDVLHQINGLPSLIQ